MHFVILWLFAICSKYSDLNFHNSRNASFYFTPFDEDTEKTLVTPEDQNVGSPLSSCTMSHSVNHHTHSYSQDTIACWTCALCLSFKRWQEPFPPFLSLPLVFFYSRRCYLNLVGLLNWPDGRCHNIRVKLSGPVQECSKQEPQYPWGRYSVFCCIKITSTKWFTSTL